MKKKENFQWQKYFGIILFFLITGGSGYFIGLYIAKKNLSGVSTSKFFVEIGAYIILFYVATVMQIIIHEGGHLIGGLLSGYKFSSFRIFNFMWIKDNDKLIFKKFSLAGTGGQCLMSPPEFIDEKIPYKLYNLGGAIFNLVVSCIFLGLYLLWTNIQFLSVFFIIISIIGIAFAIMNGIPMRLAVVDNDGYNALSLGKNSSALKAFWVQMKVNELLSKEIRIKDMPEELFIIPSDEEMKNSMTATMGVLTCNRFMDENKFEDAQKLIRKLLDIDTAMVGLHRSLLICDEIYCKAILGNSKEEIESLLDKEQKKFMKSMKKFPSVLRTQYVYALLVKGDFDKADKIKKEFNKISITYPYKSDIESEYELIEIADNKYNKVIK